MEPISLGLALLVGFAKSLARSRIDVVDVVEAGREEEVIGRDTPKRCDNRRSLSEARFTIRASRTWRRQTVVQTENARTIGGTASAGFDAVKLNMAVQETMRESFSSTNEVTRTFEQAFEVTVPPGVLQMVTLEWKRIWQIGYIVVLMGGARVEVPFKVLVDIDYDQIHETVQ